MPRDNCHHRHGRLPRLNARLAGCALLLLLGACSNKSVNTTPLPSGGGAAGSGGLDAGGFGNATDSGVVQPMLRDAGIVYASLADRPCPAGSTLSYANFGAQFFTTYCERCHASTNLGLARNGAPTGVSFDTLMQIQTLRSVIWNMAGDKNTMMPAMGQKPSVAERTQLGEWLACGAPAGTPGADAGGP